MSNTEQNQTEQQNHAEESAQQRRASEVNKLFRISGFLQLVFIVIAILAMAFAQAIGAQLGLGEVLKVLGACIAVEIIVVWAIGVYIHLTQGTLDDVSHNVLDMSAKAATTVKNIAETAAAEGKNAIAAAKEAADDNADVDGNDKAEAEAEAEDTGDGGNANADDDKTEPEPEEKAPASKPTRKRSTRTKQA